MTQNRDIFLKLQCKRLAGMLTGVTTETFADWVLFVVNPYTFSVCCTWAVGFM